MAYKGSIISPSGREYPVTFDEEPTQADLDFVAQDIAHRESDTGQSLASSAGYAVARGVAGIVPSAIEGLGALIPGNSGEELRSFGKALQEDARLDLPVNPVYQQSFPVRVSQALGISLALSLWVVPLSVLIWRRVGRKTPDWAKGWTRSHRTGIILIFLFAFGWLLLPAPEDRAPIRVEGWTISGIKDLKNQGPTVQADEITHHSPTETRQVITPVGKSPSDIIGNSFRVLINAAYVCGIAYIFRSSVRTLDIGIIESSIYVLAWALIFAAIAGSNAGYHWEEMGEDSYRVLDYEPTRAQRLAEMAGSFIIVLVAAGAGAFLGWRDRSQT